MPTLYLLFSHTLTPEQAADARASLGVGALEPLPPELQARFSNVPPELDALADYAAPFADWLASRAGPTDWVLVQGDFGLTHLLVAWCLRTGHGQPVYATTARVHTEAPQPDGSVLVTKTFRHARFRKYEAG
jgi:hypothetical protein